MSIGERRHRVTFQALSFSQDAFGEPDKVWTTLCTSQSLVQPIRGKEMQRANQAMAELTTRIVTRNRSELANLKPSDRATWNGHTYDIKYIIHRDHKRHELEIMCTEHID